MVEGETLAKGKKPVLHINLDSGLLSWRGALRSIPTSVRRGRLKVRPWPKMKSLCCLSILF